MELPTYGIVITVDPDKVDIRNYGLIARATSLTLHTGAASEPIMISRLINDGYYTIGKYYIDIAETKADVLSMVFISQGMNFIKDIQLEKNL